MAEWNPSSDSGIIGVQPIANSETTQAHPIGTRVRARSTTYGNGEFIYLKGVASTAVGSWVHYSLLSGLTTLAAANAVGPVGMAMSANTTTTSYGWYQIYGLTSSGAAGGAIAIDTKIYGAGSGTVDDAVVDGDMIHNALCVSTVTGAGAATGAGCFFIFYPYSDDIAGND